MKSYVVTRSAKGARGNVVAMVATEGSLNKLRHIVVHSPDGFEMGYGGSGPADLALSILCDHLGVEKRDEQSEGFLRAWRLHQPFKREHVAPHQNGFDIDEEQIDKWIKLRESEQS